MCEVNCANCRVSAFKHGLCPDDFCEKHKALGTEDDFIGTLQRKTGMWVVGESVFFAGKMHQMPMTCSCCGRSALDEPWKFCPNCGAKMEEGEQDGQT